MMNMKDLPMLPLPLSVIEREELAQYEGTIYKGLNTFFEVGKALIEIRNRKLYRADYRTFEHYCRERWNISRPRAYQLIDAANVVDGLSTHGSQILPANERQARALKAAPPEQRQEAWKKAVDASNGTQPTAKQINQVIQMEIPIPGPEFEWTTCEDCGGRFERLSTKKHDTRCGPCAFKHRNAHTSPQVFLPDYLTKEPARLTFTIMFDAEHNCERLSKSLRVRDIEPDMPVLDDVAEEKGWCEGCRYAETIHYMNSEGRKWCTLSILKNEYLKRQLQTDKITVYRDKPEPKSQHSQNSNEYNPDNEHTPGTDEFWFKQSQLSHWELFKQYQRLREAWGNDSSKQQKLEANIRDLEAEVKDLKRKRDTAVQCYEQLREAQHTEGEMTPFAFYTEDRIKILKAGFRIFRVLGHMKELRELTFLTPGKTATWKKFETFDTKKALKERIKELEQDERIIFDNHL
jgi:hypothetical protein